MNIVDCRVRKLILVNPSSNALGILKGTTEDHFRGFQECRKQQHQDSIWVAQFVFGKVSRQTFENIVTSTRNILSKWKANTLSLPGRAILVQSNITSKASYQMQSFLIPRSLHNELDKIYRDFLWTKDPTRKSSNLIG